MLHKWVKDFFLNLVSFNSFFTVHNRLRKILFHQKINNLIWKHIFNFSSYTHKNLLLLYFDKSVGDNVALICHENVSIDFWWGVEATNDTWSYKWKLLFRRDWLTDCKAKVEIESSNTQHKVFIRYVLLYLEWHD